MNLFFPKVKVWKIINENANLHQKGFNMDIQLFVKHNDGRLNFVIKLTKEKYRGSDEATWDEWYHSKELFFYEVSRRRHMRKNGFLERYMCMSVNRHENLKRMENFIKMWQNHCFLLYSS